MSPYTKMVNFEHKWEIRTHPELTFPSIPRVTEPACHASCIGPRGLLFIVALRLSCPINLTAKRYRTHLPRGYGPQNAASRQAHPFTQAQAEALNLDRYSCTYVGRTDTGDLPEPSPGLAPPQGL